MHDENALFAILVTVFGTKMLVMLGQLVNVVASIEVINNGISRGPVILLLYDAVIEPPELII